MVSPLHDPVWILDFQAKWPYNSINICKQSNVFIVIYSKHFSFASPSSLANIILLYRTLFSSIKSQFLTLFSSKYETSDTVQHLSTNKMLQSVSCNVESWNALFSVLNEIEVGSLFSKSCNLLNNNVIPFKMLYLLLTHSTSCTIYHRV